MRNLVDILCWVIGIIALGIAIWQFILFVNSPGVEGNTTHLWYAIGAAIVGLVSLLGYFLRHVNKEEEIHITQ